MAGSYEAMPYAGEAEYRIGGVTHGHAGNDQGP